jgi:hypothetical protein
MFMVTVSDPVALEQKNCVSEGAVSIVASSRYRLRNWIWPPLISGAACSTVSRMPSQSPASAGSSDDLQNAVVLAEHGRGEAAGDGGKHAAIGGLQLRLGGAAGSRPAARRHRQHDHYGHGGRNHCPGWETQGRAVLDWETRDRENAPVETHFVELPLRVAKALSSVGEPLIVYLSTAASCRDRPSP